MTTLREFVEHIDETAVMEFTEKKYVDTVFCYVDSDGVYGVVAVVSMQDKETLVIAMRDLFSRLNVVRFVMVNEAWRVNLENDSGVRQRAETWIEQHGSLEEFPGREEALVYWAEDEREGFVAAERTIDRAGGVPTLGPLVFSDCNNHEGLMVGMLPQRGAVH